MDPFDEAIRNRDYFLYNKYSVLELLEAIDSFVSCDLTDPLIVWKNNFLIPIKGMLFCDSSARKRPSRYDPQRPDALVFSQIKTKSTNYLCSHLYHEIMNEFRKPVGFKVLKLLMYIATRLVKNWESKYDSQEFKERVNKFQFTQHNLEEHTHCKLFLHKNNKNFMRF